MSSKLFKQALSEVPQETKEKVSNYLNALEKLESFPAIIEFDHSEKDSDVQGVI